MKNTPAHALDDHALKQRLHSTVDDDLANIAVMLDAMAEIDERKLWAQEGYASMFAFCTQMCRMSQAQAGKRIRVARVVQRIPEVLAMVEQGKLHLSGIVVLATHLTRETHVDVLRRASGKTIDELKVLVAELNPKPDVPDAVRAMPKPPTPPGPSLFDGPGRGTDSSRQPSRPQAPPKSTPRPTARRTASVVEPLSAAPKASTRYKLQCTIAQETRTKLTQAQGLLAHAIPNGDLAAIVDRALDALIAQERKRKYAAVELPRKPKTRTSKRTIPAHIKRAVVERDEGQCTFCAASGKQCNTTRRLEFDHIILVALGGESTLDNLRLRCPAHNQLESAPCKAKEETDDLTKLSSPGSGRVKKGAANVPGIGLGACKSRAA